MALTILLASSFVFICQNQLSSAVSVRRELSGLTSVPQDIRTDVTKLYLQGNSIFILYNNSFHLYEKIEYIDLSLNRVWKINNGTFDNNPLLRKLECQYCKWIILPSSFGPPMSQITVLDLYLAISDTDILIPPYFGGFSSLEYIGLQKNGIYDIENISFPKSIKALRLDRNKISRLPNVSSQRFPVLYDLRLGENDIVSVSDSELAGISSTTAVLDLVANKLVEVGDITVLQNLVAVWLSNNKLESIPDMLGGLPRLRQLYIDGNSRMSCDIRMCWMRLWERVRSRILYTDDAQCMAPPSARGYRLSQISPGFMQCNQGEVSYFLKAKLLI